MSRRTTTLTLDLDAVSTLLGLVRGALDEASEQLSERINMNDEEREWYEARANTCERLAERLNSAGLRLQ